MGFALRVHVPIFTTEDGGVHGADKSGAWNGEIYYIGIIDILQVYNVRKGAETLLKGLKYDKKEISSVNPSLYAKRFVKFLEDNCE